jgi:hypothetical protein
MGLRCIIFHTFLLLRLLCGKQLNMEAGMGDGEHLGVQIIIGVPRSQQTSAR